MELRLVKGSGPPRKSRPSTIRLREGLTIGRGADDQPVDVQLDCPGGRDARGIALPKYPFISRIHARIHANCTLECVGHGFIPRAV